MPSSMGAQNNTKRAANAVPQPLPPSVEEAYRRKCCQLRHRYNQMEDHNDAARLRLHRLRRQLDKLRVERAFLLEQVARRTSMNVEDSEGSPSPPPTVGFPSPPPKEKPLRIKRGHRKPSALPDLDKPDQPPSPSSETSRAANGAAAKAAGAADDVDSPFMLYVCETGEGPADAEALRGAWEGMEKEEREGWASRFEERVARKEREGEETEAEIEAEPEIEVEGDGEGEGEGEGDGEGDEGDDVEVEKEDKEGDEREKGEDEDVEMGEAEEKK